jgi:hypothetical protein
VSLATERRPDALDNFPYHPRLECVKEQRETLPTGNDVRSIAPTQTLDEKVAQAKCVLGDGQAAYQSPAPVESGDRGLLGETFQREKVSAQEQRAGKGNNFICQSMKRAYLHMAITGCIILIN